MAKFLDKHGINWEYETLVVPYHDREKGISRSTIPDFYLPDFNLFIEVKGNAEFKTQNTHDKLRGVRKQGYKIILFGKKEIKILKEDPSEILLKIK